jgi:hypothetical protein
MCHQSNRVFSCQRQALVELIELRFLPFDLRNCYSYFYEFGDRWREAFVFGAGDDFIL